MGWFKRNESSSDDAPSDPVAGDATSSEDSGGAVEPPAELADFFLLLGEHLTAPELEEIEKSLDAPRQPPPLLERVSRGLDDPEELKETILSSPALSADVLRVVNSAAFMLSAPISSIEDAVVYLGTNLVKGLALQSAVTQVMDFSTDVQQAAYMRLWRASYVASAAAQGLAQSARYDDPPLLATRALLSCVGDLALIAARAEMSYLYAPKAGLFSRLETQQREIMGNSAIMHWLLARRWKLPSDLCDALHHAYTPMVRSPESNSRDELTRLEDVVLYTAICIGHDVAFRGLDQIADFSINRGEELEFFYLPAYYAQLDIPRPETVFAARKHAIRVQHVIESVHDQ